MTETISDETWDIVNQLLSGDSDEDRLDALESLEGLEEKQELDALATYFTSLLRNERLEKQRSWIISGLGAIKRGEEVVKEYLDPDIEPRPQVRYWATIALAKISDPRKLKENLRLALSDVDDLIIAVALRLLIEYGFERNYTYKLVQMFRSGDLETRIAACKAFQRRASVLDKFSTEAQNKFLELLIECLDNRTEAEVCRIQAAYSIGDLLEASSESDKKSEELLIRVIKTDSSPRVQLACLESLKKIIFDGPKPLLEEEIKEVLLEKVTDIEPAIRENSAIALKGLLGMDPALEIIIDELLQNDEINSNYIDALKIINQPRSLSLLSKRISIYTDPVLTERVVNVFRNLGSESSFIETQAKRKEMIEAYTKLLNDVNSKFIGHFHNLTKQANIAFIVSVIFYSFVSLLSMIILAISLRIALSGGTNVFRNHVSVGTAIASLITIFILFFRSPLQDLRQSAKEIGKVAIIFMGYVRQINQIDAAFKHLVLYSDELELEEMQTAVDQLQTAMEGSIEGISEAIDGFQV